MGQNFVNQRAQLWSPLGSAEQQHLLRLLQPTPAARETNDTVPDPFDWQTFVQRTRYDGLAPLLYQHFRESEARLPDHVYSHLRHSYYQNVAVNLLRFEELQRLGRLLAEEGIRLLVLKGAALALTVYPDPGLRFMGDLDVAVPPEQTMAALALLQRQGYRLQDEASLGHLSPRDLVYQEGWHIGLSRMVRGKEMVLELHWPQRPHVLVNQVARLNVRELWATAVPLDRVNNLWQPAPAMMLFHLCLHTGLQHRFTDLGLRPYIDLERVIRYGRETPAFWSQLVALAKASGTAHVSFFCLQLTGRLQGAPVPADTLAALAPPRWKQRLFQQRLQPGDILNRRRLFYGRQRLAWRLLTVDRPLDLLVGPWQLLFPGRDYLSSYYRSQDPWHLAAYAVRHPVHALARATRRRLKLLAHLAARRRPAPDSPSISEPIK